MDVECEDRFSLAFRDLNHLLFAILVLLSGCSPPSPPDNTEIQEWFDGNYESLTELASLGSEHKVLQRVEPDLGKYRSYFGQPTETDLKAEERVLEIVEQLKIDFVAYDRDGREENPKLYAMRVPYYRWGLSLGGYSKSIVYFPDHVHETMEPSPYGSYFS